MKFTLASSFTSVSSPQNWAALAVGRACYADAHCQKAADVSDWIKSQDDFSMATLRKASAKYKRAAKECLAAAQVFDHMIGLKERPIAAAVAAAVAATAETTAETAPCTQAPSN